KVIKLGNKIMYYWKKCNVFSFYELADYALYYFIHLCFDIGSRVCGTDLLVCIGQQSQGI
ncbi:hypothetical protein J4536_22790, partial [Escherichia coli]|nr:hypothetical protein [Escherichia coli]